MKGISHFYHIFLLLLYIRCISVESVEHDIINDLIWLNLDWSSKKNCQISNHQTYVICIINGKALRFGKWSHLSTHFVIKNFINLWIFHFYIVFLSWISQRNNFSILSTPVTLHTCIDLPAQFLLNFSYIFSSLDIILECHLES